MEEAQEEEETEEVTEDKIDLQQPIKETSLRNANMKETKINLTMVGKESILTSKMNQEKEAKDKEEAVKYRTKIS